MENTSTVPGFKEITPSELLMWTFPFPFSVISKLRKMHGPLYFFLYISLSEYLIHMNSSFSKSGKSTDSLDGFPTLDYLHLNKSNIFKETISLSLALGK